MNNGLKNYIGRDSSDVFAGALVTIFIAIAIVILIITLIVYGGIFIGLFYSIKNYLISFKENVIDSNLKLKTT